MLASQKTGRPSSSNTAITMLIKQKDLRSYLLSILDPVLLLAIATTAAQRSRFQKHWQTEA